jgi:hypothetical protein
LTTGLPDPSSRHSQVFSTSQCFLPPLTFPALFHAGRTLGIRPLELSLRGNPVRLVGVRSPPVVTRVRLHESPRLPAAHVTSHPGRLQGFFPPASPCTWGPGVSPNSAVGALLGLLPSKGLPQHEIASISQGLLSRFCRVASTGLATRFDCTAKP